MGELPPARPVQVCFVDETSDLQTLYDDDKDAAPGPGPLKSLLPVRHAGPSSSRQHAEHGNVHSTSNILHDYRDLDQRTLSAFPPGSRLGLSNRADATLQAGFYPLHSWREAKLMKYYIEHMCSWKLTLGITVQFDPCDSAQHFAIDVPRKAMSCPALLNAIFALSSRHLSLKGKHFDHWISNQYHDQCLQQLSSITSDTQALLDDDLLAATVILRTLEEIEGVDALQ
ncbi:hypothetical protein DCS_03563 [Drechmeria coniospora]|uniref:Uncharacterized protein n=1 Tax=Drechmeria coniospora TaxID=98403 RepID=A0A151GHG3_DRECN|nr:hypothetical protein DCS_03563 [Drechmeria coniospora]KYK56563.1 hypothetical protein DCS_03563 [Drechmeria coniospora]